MTKPQNRSWEAEDTVDYADKLWPTVRRMARRALAAMGKKPTATDIDPDVVIVSHTVAVSVEIDLRNRQVTRVTVWDEHLSKPEGVYFRFDNELSNLIGTELGREAITIEDENQDWPGWRFGC